MVIKWKYISSTQCFLDHIEVCFKILCMDSSFFWHYLNNIVEWFTYLNVNRRIFVYIFKLLAYAFYSLIKLLKKLSEHRKSIAVSVICENVCPIYRIVPELWKTRNFKKNVWAHWRFCHLAIFDGCYFLCYCLQRAEDCSD